MLIPEPRSMTRMVYDMAMREAVTNVVKQELLNALNWYEEKWRIQDSNRQEIANAQLPPAPEKSTNGVPDLTSKEPL